MHRAPIRGAASMPADALQERLATALACHRRGELQQARAGYLEILESHPGCFDALHLLGALSADTGSVTEGIHFIERAIGINANSSMAHYNLAAALLKRGNDGAALSSLDRALALRPEFAAAWLLRGNVLQRGGRFEESVECYRRAIGVQPAFPEAYNNLAAAQRASRQWPEAFESANRALALQPEYPSALNNRGLIYLDCRQGAAAAEDFRRAVALNPKFAEAWHNLGTALMELRRFIEAGQAFAQLAALAPGFRHVQGNLMLARLNCCDWTNFDSAAGTLVDAVQRGEHATTPFALLSICGSAALQLRCARLYADAFFPPAPSRTGRVHCAHDKIRVAYLSGDFGEHALTYLLAGVWERHDSKRFETVALSWGRHDDGPVRRRVEASFSRFIDVTSFGDRRAADLLRELEIDIAVDLGGHTLGQRTGILARRPAPVQANYLGLPATMGASYMDYLIADPFLVTEAHQAHYSEKLVWLCGGFQPNDDKRDLQPSGQPRRAVGLPDEGFVFCCFNRNTKLNPACFDVWMRLLKAVPGSVLWLLASNPAAEQNLRREAARRGVDVDRLVFACDVPYADYMARYTHADLFLDTVPFNGGATVSDAVSMGVPVVTCAGDSFAGRMAGSVLTFLGMPDLITGSLAEYEALALKLAGHPERVYALRKTLREQRTQHSFFETDRYRRSLESAYERMWERHTSGLPPAAFYVA
jgi:protein O-GlcNAc transferase